MTTDLASTFAAQIAGLDIPEDDNAALPLGQIYWLHGNKTAKTPGVFYGKTTEFSAAPGAPWAADDRFDTDPGYSAARIKIAFIGIRSQWFLPGADEQSPRTWITDYQQGARKSVECIVLVEGVDEPLLLTGNKVSKTKPIERLLTEYRNGLLRQASRVAGKQLPLWAFWLPVGNPVDANGKTVYTEVSGKDGKSSFVTEPRVYYPENPMDALFVGAELLQLGADIHRQYHDWLREPHLNVGTVNGDFAVETTPALPAPKNPVTAIDTTDGGLDTY